jgi:hypothetical protein
MSVDGEENRAVGLAVDLLCPRSRTKLKAGDVGADRCGFVVLVCGTCDYNILTVSRSAMADRRETQRWYCIASWQRRRAHQLHTEPLCRLCLEAGRVVPAAVADHVQGRLHRLPVRAASQPLQGVPRQSRSYEQPARAGPRRWQPERPETPLERPS